MIPANKEFLHPAMQSNGVTNQPQQQNSTAASCGADTIYLVVKVGEDKLIDTVIRGIKNRSRANGTDVIFG